MFCSVQMLVFVNERCVSVCVCFASIHNRMEFRFPELYNLTLTYSRILVNLWFYLFENVYMENTNCFLDVHLSIFHILIHTHSFSICLYFQFKVINTNSFVLFFLLLKICIYAVISVYNFQLCLILFLIIFVCYLLLVSRSNTVDTLDALTIYYAVVVFSFTNNKWDGSYFSMLLFAYLFQFRKCTERICMVHKGNSMLFFVLFKLN